MIVVGIVFRVVSLGALLLVTADSGPLAWLAGNAPVPDRRDRDRRRGSCFGSSPSRLLIASALAVVGLLRRSQNGWVLAVITSGAILALNLGWWAAGEPRYGSMVVNVVVLFYLNQRDLRAYFGDPT